MDTSIYARGVSVNTQGPGITKREIVLDSATAINAYSNTDMVASNRE